MAAVPPRANLANNIPSKNEATVAVYKIGHAFFKNLTKNGDVESKCRAHLLSKFIDDADLYSAIAELGAIPLNAEEKLAALRASLTDVLLEQLTKKKA